ncbi:MAG: DinB family protein [Rubripirellula sp.]|nr:DinB family protein [Rubripirellula sp.]
MNGKEAIHASANLSDLVLKNYISDLDDTELMTRPGEECNHLAWQLGHLIASEVNILDSVAPGKAITLPDGFSEAHTKETCASDVADDFCKKQEYVELYEQIRQATNSALNAATESELAAPAPESFRSFCPTVADVYILMASHPMMHAGQFAVARRKIGKPILM